jgi:hypothetical protein
MVGRHFWAIFHCLWVIFSQKHLFTLTTFIALMALKGYKVTFFFKCFSIDSVLLKTELVNVLHKFTLVTSYID